VAEWLSRAVLIPMAFAVWIGQQRERWRLGGTMRVMRLGPDDVVVLEIDRVLTAQQANDTDAILQSLFPKHKVVVLHGGWKLSVVRPETPDAAEPQP
jgi:hypothetical protein